MVVFVFGVLHFLYLLLLLRSLRTVRIVKLFSVEYIFAPEPASWGEKSASPPSFVATWPAKYVPDCQIHKICNQIAYKCKRYDNRLKNNKKIQIKKKKRKKKKKNRLSKSSCHRNIKSLEQSICLYQIAARMFGAICFHFKTKVMNIESQSFYFYGQYTHGS